MGAPANDATLTARGLKDPFSSLSHFVGSGLAIVGTIVLLIRSDGRPWHFAAFAIYGASLTALYLASGIYHAVRTENDWLQKFDHFAIYLVIAGTYAPLCLIALRGAWGTWMLAAEYAMAATGIVAIVLMKGGPKWLRLALYLAMGWLALVAISPLTSALTTAATWWLFAGGVTYSVGTIVYAAKRPRLWPGTFGSHELWHLFVMAGSACHFVVMLTLSR